MTWPAIDSPYAAPAPAEPGLAALNVAAAAREKSVVMNFISAGDCGAKETVKRTWNEERKKEKPWLVERRSEGKTK